MPESLKNRLYRLLRWSERYTHLDMVYFASGSFWIGVGLVSNGLSSFVSAVLFGNLLPKDLYGTYKYILTLAGVLGNFSLTGLRTALTRSTSLRYDGDLGRAFWLSIRWSFLLITASYIVGLYYFLNDNFTLGIAMLMFGSLSPLLNAANLYSFYLTGARRFRQENFYSIGRDWIPLGSLAFTLYLTHNVLVLSFVYFISNTAAALFFFWRTVRQIPPSSPTSPTLMSYSAHLSVMGLVAGAIGQADNLLVFHYLGAAELAVYSFASAIPGQFQNISKTFYTLALPKFSTKSTAEIKFATYLRLMQTFVLGLIGSVLYMTVAPYLFSWFFPHYMDAIPYTKLLAITILFSSMGSIASAYFDSQQEVQNKYIITVFSNFSKLFLMIILFQKFGIFGIIWGIIISWVLTLLLQITLIGINKKQPD